MGRPKGPERLDMEASDTAISLVPARRTTRSSLIDDPVAADQWRLRRTRSGVAGASRSPLHPELVHAGERAGVLALDTPFFRFRDPAGLRESSLAARRLGFKGRFAKIIPFRYRTTMTITGVGDGVATLVASRRLGPVLGTFAMTAVATPTTFEAEFSSKNDCGRFVLTRCCVG